MTVLPRLSLVCFTEREERPRGRGGGRGVSLLVGFKAGNLPANLGSSCVEFGDLANATASQVLLDNDSISRKDPELLIHIFLELNLTITQMHCCRYLQTFAHAPDDIFSVSLLISR